MKTYLAFFVGCLVAAVTCTEAATIKVTNTADSGAGSLRAALAAATNGVTIDVTDVSGTITLITGALLVEKSVAILGPGPAVLAINGNFPNTTNRVFDVRGNVNVTIAGLTIINGSFPNGDGGGIYNFQSTLTVSNCILHGNSAGNGGGIYNYNAGGQGSLAVKASILERNTASYGGGIYTDGSSGNAFCLVIGSTLSSNSAPFGGGLYNNGRSGNAFAGVSDSTISNNRAFTDEIIGGGAGGGIYNDGGSSGSATVSMSTSTLHNNSSAFMGGGIFNGGFQGRANLFIYASTLSGNSSAFKGGGIANSAIVGIALALVNASTFSGNSADFSGGGIYNEHGTVQLGDTILNAGASGANLASDSGSWSSAGYNLSSDSALGQLIGTGDRINIDPILGPLANNGGPTFTHALLQGSPAIDQGKRDAIPSLVLDVDQRSRPRPIDFSSVTNASGGDGSDIGSFEAIPPARFTSIAPFDQNSMRLEGVGLSNFAYTIQANFDLNPGNWIIIGTAPAEASGAFSFIDTNTATFWPTRFYRAQSP